MKKEYISPQLEAVKIENNDQLLLVFSSNTVSGKGLGDKYLMFDDDDEEDIYNNAR